MVLCPFNPESLRPRFLTPRRVGVRGDQFLLPTPTHTLIAQKTLRERESPTRPALALRTRGSPKWQNPGFALGASAGFSGLTRRDGRRRIAAQ